MPIYDVIRSHEISKSYRLDAEYAVHPKKQWLMSLASKNKFVRLGTILKHISSGHTPYKHDMVSGDINFITVECVDSLFLDESRLKRITEGQYSTEFLVNRIIQGSIVCTIKRRICKAYPFLSPITKPLAMNQDVAFLIPKPGISAGYIAAYLSCNIGQTFADRQKTEQMNPYLSVSNLANLPIALLSDVFQEKIEIKLQQGYQLFTDSANHFTKAEQLLLAEIGLIDWKPTHSPTFVRNYRQASQSKRIDAEYFQPKFGEILERLSAYPLKSLSKLATQVTETVTFSEMQKYRYIEISDVNTTNGEVGYTERELKQLPPNAKVKVKGGELIVSKVRPTRGAIGIIPDDCRDNGVCSSAFVVLNVPTPRKEFLQVYLRSMVGKALLEQPCKGTSYPTIDDIDVLRLPIPIISIETQEKISGLVIQSHAARREAKALLEKAKRAVEIAIEENEERAIEFIE